MIDIVKPRRPKAPIITELFAIVTPDQSEGEAPGEGIITMETDGQSLPLVCISQRLATLMWQKLMECDDPEIKGRTYRLIRIHGRRDVILEQAK